MCFIVFFVGSVFWKFVIFEDLNDLFASNLRPISGSILEWIFHGFRVHFWTILEPNGRPNGVKNRSEKWHRKKVVQKTSAGFPGGPSQGPGGG